MGAPVTPGARPGTAWNGFTLDGARPCEVQVRDDHGNVRHNEEEGSSPSDSTPCSNMNLVSCIPRTAEPCAPDATATLHMGSPGHAVHRRSVVTSSTHGGRP